VFLLPGDSNKDHNALVLLPGSSNMDNVTFVLLLLLPGDSLWDIKKYNDTWNGPVGSWGVTRGAYETERLISKSTSPSEILLGDLRLPKCVCPCYEYHWCVVSFAIMEGTIIMKTVAIIMCKCFGAGNTKKRQNTCNFSCVVIWDRVPGNTKEA